MSQQLSVDSMTKQYQLFLKSKARNLPSASLPSLVFKIDNKINFKIVDSDKKVYTVNQQSIQSFRQIFQDGSFKHIKVSNWQFSLNTHQRKCISVELKADNVVFIANKNNKKQLKQIDFKVTILNADQIKSLPKEISGYIRRLVKAHYLKNCQNINQQFYCLVSFVKRPNQLKVNRISNFIDQETQEQKPLQFINSQGKKVIQKLKNFITRQDVFDFIVRQQLSTETQKKLRDLIVPPQSQTSAHQTKKKKVKAQ